MKFLGIVCSPRRRGNTARLVEAVLFGARSRGAETEIFYSGDLKVNPCRVCYSCETTGKCVQEDDMRLVYEAIAETSVIVFGTPIYHDHVSAQAKIFTDRLYAYELTKSFPKGVKVVIIITYEWNNPNGYDDVLEWIRGTFRRYYGVETVAALKVCDTTERPVAQRPDLLREAQSVGESLAKG